MTELQNTFLNMIRTTLWDEPFAFGEGVTPRDLYNEACRYELAGFTWEKREILCAGDAATRRMWLKSSAEVQKKTRSILAAQSALCRLLSAESIQPVFVKGLASARYYPNPMQRYAGDIDFIVLPGDFDRACDLMERSGYLKGIDNRRHIDFSKDGVELECHRFFTHTGQGSEAVRENVLQAGCRSCVEASIGEHRFFTLPDAEYGIMQLEHLSHHLSGGIGFRQYIDWILYVNACAGDEAWLRRFEELCRECSLERLAKVMTRTAQLHLGLKTEGIFPCDDISDELCDKFVAFLFTCDDFGFTLEESESLASLTNIMRRGFFKTLDEQAMMRMPAARKHFILRPAAWIAQLFFWLAKGFRGFILRGDKVIGSSEELKKQKQTIKDFGA